MRPIVYFLKTHIDSSSGASKAIVDIMNALVESGWEVVLIVTKRTTKPFYKLNEKVKVEKFEIKTNPFVRHLPYLHEYFQILKLRKKFKESKIRLLVAFNYGPAAIRAAVNTNTNVIVSERSNFDNPLENEGKFSMRKRWYPLASAITSNSRTTVSDVKELIKSDNVYFTPNPYLLPYKESQLSFSQKPKIILVVGRFTYRKAYDVLFNALGKIKDQLGDWKVNIVGDGPLESDIKQLAKELGIESKLNYLGTTNNVDIHFENAGMFILPSRFEGVPNAMLDAMKFGLPMIISAVPGSLEYVVDEKNGLVFPIGDAESLSAQIVRLINDDDLREKLGKAAFKSACETAQSNNVKPWEDVFKKVLN